MLRIVIKSGERQQREWVERGEYVQAGRFNCQQLHITETVLTKMGWEGADWNHVAQGTASS